MSDQTTAVAAQTAEERVAQDVAKFSPAEAKLAAFSDYLKLTINGIGDKDGRLMVSNARKEVKRERTGLENMREAFVENAVKYQRGVNAAAKVLREKFEEIEDHLKAEEAKIEKLEEEERTREAREKEKMIEDRKMRLYSLGLTWNGSMFIGQYGVTFTEQQIVTATQEEWQEVTDDAERKLADYTVAQKAIAQAEEERKQRVKDEEAKQEAIRKENEAKAQALAEKERKLNDQVNDSRRHELLALGMLEKYGMLVLGTMTVVVDTLHTLNDKDWKDTLAGAHTQRGILKEQAIAAERKTILDGRVKELRAVGYTFITELQLGIVADGKQVITGLYELADLEHDLYAELFGIGEVEMGRRKLAEQEQLRKEGEERGRQRIANEAAAEEIRKVECAAKLSDFEKFTEWTSNILVAAPVLTSEVGKRAVDRLCDHVKDMASGVEKDLK